MVQSVLLLPQNIALTQSQFRGSVVGEKLCSALSTTEAGLRIFLARSKMLGTQSLSSALDHFPVTGNELVRFTLSSLLVCLMVQIHFPQLPFRLITAAYIRRGMDTSENQVALRQSCSECYQKVGNGVMEAPSTASAIRREETRSGCSSSS